MSEKITKMELEIRVRYPEVDQMGYVHHSRYWQYFEMGRIEMLRRQGYSYAEMERMGIFVVVVKAAIRYHLPAKFDEIIVVKTTIKKIGAARIDYEYEVRRKDDNALICTAETTLASVDSSGQLTALPEFLREMA
ncbi:MAG TPA: thioesterase family protein [Phycisphaerae bacterium]|nr:thioesterase family protein [Phycisphaerae bacterium]HPS52077.1 thioesterase family protein [Phycisphaerae bacterium]